VSVTRRGTLRLGAVAALGGLTSCRRTGVLHGADIAGFSPALRLDMARAPDGAGVTEATFRGRPALLCFGYTSCPDLCPLTLSNIARGLAASAKGGHDMRVLFVTVDPRRDTLPILGHYTALFGPQFVGLRGTPAQLARLAQRYKVAYAASDATVTHSTAVYLFDAHGRARELFSGLDRAQADIAGFAADLDRLRA